MIKIFTGTNRPKISEAIKKFLGENYENIEGEKLTLNDLPSLFLGASLLSSERKILIKDLGENKDKTVFEKILDYQTTEHSVAIWETKLDKRTASFKNLKKSKIEIIEHELAEKVDSRLALGIFDMALKNGERALKMAEQIETTQDPYMFFGLLATQAIKKFEQNQGTKEKRVLKELSRVDQQMKSTKLEPWTILKSFLLRLSSL